VLTAADWFRGPRILLVTSMSLLRSAQHGRRVAHSFLALAAARVLLAFAAASTNATQTRFAVLRYLPTRGPRPRLGHGRPDGCESPSACRLRVVGDGFGCGGYVCRLGRVLSAMRAPGPREGCPRGVAPALVSATLGSGERGRIRGFPPRRHTTVGATATYADTLMSRHVLDPLRPCAAPNSGWRPLTWGVAALALRERQAHRSARDELVQLASRRLNPRVVRPSVVANVLLPRHSLRPNASSMALWGYLWFGVLSGAANAPHRDPWRAFGRPASRLSLNASFPSYLGSLGPRSEASRFSPRPRHLGFVGAAGELAALDVLLVEPAAGPKG